MTDSSEYTIGAEVRAGDEPCGQLSRVVVDPLARTLTHLVVSPHQRWEPARLVPIELVRSSAPEISLSCGPAAFLELADAEETHFLTEPDPRLGYEAGEAYMWPYYGLGMGAGALGMGYGGGVLPVTYDKVPADEVEVRRDEHVHATDGDIGRIKGLVIDPSDHHVTHLLLQEGHLWGKHDVAIPIGAVRSVDPDGVRLTLSRDEVRDLPAVELASG
ncbi:MAG TPA: PRC-barrel domain-containing protein [Solirubrobacteraceae bacterium]|nr:PRC-barrel domain-containing protein [Solirubrobacteraceae bacterium]